MNSLLRWAIIIIAGSGSAVVWGFSFLNSNKFRVQASAFGVRDPAVDLATVSALLGTILLLVGVGLLIGGLAQHNKTGALESILPSDDRPPQSGMPTPRLYQYDEVKWRALIEFDPDIARVEAALRPYGNKYVDQFAAGYLVLNDKTYIPNLVEKVVQTARQDAAEAKAAEERWGKRFSDPGFVLKFAQDKFDFLVSRPYGNIAMLKNGPVFLLGNNGQVLTYPDAASLREATNDREQWWDIADADSKVNFVRTLLPHIPV
jgi:hypothetical protein